VWTRRAQAEAQRTIEPDLVDKQKPRARSSSEPESIDVGRPEPVKTVPKPTYTHMCLVALQNNGILKHLVSQNCDGLHIKSGIRPSNISELHGNCNVEACADCGTTFYRDFRVRSNQNAAKTTGRMCETPGCTGKLRYTTVAFSQSMPNLTLHQAEQHSMKCDLSLCMGTSMRVSPACDLPLMGKKKNKSHKLVIVNLQKTPYDDHCCIRIFATVDKVMTLLMEHLGMSQMIPEYKPFQLTPDFFQLCKTDWKFRTPDDTWFRE